MNDLKYYNAELPGEAAARRARAVENTSGSRSHPGALNVCEAILLATLKRQGYEVANVGEYPRFVRRIDEAA